MTPITAWQKTLWVQLASQGMSHATIFHGQEGLGHLDFALNMAKAKLCESQTESKPCHQCEACRWFDTGSHPDFQGLLPEDLQSLLPHDNLIDDVGEEVVIKNISTNDDKADKKLSQVIKVAHIRSMIDSLGTASYRSGQRVVLLGPLESLEPISANTLLKTLEEPPENTIFLLFTYRLDRILPTIKSRCRLIAMPKPSEEDALAWLSSQVASANLEIDSQNLLAILREEGGAPARAWQRIFDLEEQSYQESLQQLLHGLGQGRQVEWIKLSESINKVPLREILILLQKWLYDLLLFRTVGYAKFYPQTQVLISACAAKANTAKLREFLKAVSDSRKSENHPLANRVQIESLLIRYKNIFEA